MLVKANRVLWLSSPDRVKELDFNDGQRLAEQLCQVKPELDMAKSGWLRLGEVSLFMRIDRAPAELLGEAVVVLRQAVAEYKQESHEKVLAMEDRIAELLCLEAPLEVINEDNEETQL